MKDIPYFVIWCSKVNSYKKYEEHWDAFYTYEDAKAKYDNLVADKLVTGNLDNVKLTQVIEEKSKGLDKQEYYA